MSFARGFQLARFGFRHLGTMSRGRRRVERHLAAPSEHPVPPPTFVQLRVTNLCNLRCRMCGQWGESGIYRSQGGAEADDGSAERARIRELIGLGRQMSLADYRRLLDEIEPHRPIVSLYGGEPLLYPDIVPLVADVKRRGLVATIITNGGRLAENADGLVAAGIDAISVSVDGPEALHDEIRGAGGSFRRLADGIRAVAAARKRLGRAEPMILANLPVTEMNMSRIDEALGELRELPIDTVNVGLRWFVTPAAGARYEEVLRESFGSRADSWQGFRFEWTPRVAESHAAGLADLVKLMGTLRRRRWTEAPRGRPWISFVPAVAADDVPRWFADPGESFGHDLCPVAWYFAQVEPDGDVTFCGDFPDVVLGNVRRQSFDEVWRGEVAEAFRARLRAAPLPVCSRCCGSYVYGKWSRAGVATG